MELVTHTQLMTQSLLNSFSSIRHEMHQEVQDLCPYIEYEQDMNATVPFCKLDNKFCNHQCLLKRNNYEY